MLLNGGRYEFFVDLSNLKGESVLLRNDAVFPFPIGGPPDEFVSQIMRIDVQSAVSKNLRTTSSAESLGVTSNTFINSINSKLNFYQNTQV